jgi:predicted transcriptional regulator
MKKTLNVTVDQNLVAKLRSLAAREDRPMSRYVNRAVAEYFARLEEKEKQRSFADAAD